MAWIVHVLFVCNYPKKPLQELLNSHIYIP